MKEKFETLQLKPELLKNLAELKFDFMTPIQAVSLPVVLKGKDVLAQAKTGSGKTAAFGLGILNSLDVRNPYAQSLILCPTRELAEQVAKELRRLARMMQNVKVLTITGGLAERHQERSLAHGAHIVVGTPGRVQRLLKNEILNLKAVKTFVLDEADRMLDMGFFDEIKDIASYIPKKRQSLFFSATFPDEIRELGKNFQNSAVELRVDTEHEATSIDEIFYEVKSHDEKGQALLKILGTHKPDRLIVFCQTKQLTNDVAELLNKHGIYAEAINGDLEQNERTAVLTKFSNRSLSVLVATDVASRGIDIKDLAAVINYDLPSDPEVYVHRVGRTGRAGKKGAAFSLFVEKNRYKLDAIEGLTRKKCKIENSAHQLSFVNGRYDETPPMKTMYISGGKRDKLRPGDILGALVKEANLDPKDVGDITIFNILSYVAIKSDKIDQAIDKLRSGKIKNRKFNVGQA